MDPFRIEQTCSAACQGPRYTVVAGDTFTRIAQKLGISTPSLINCNPGVSPTRLQIGQHLCTPSSAQTCGAGCQGPRYTVVSGDTFTRIAQKLGVSTPTLINCNPGVSPTGLQIGQILCTPSAIAIDCGAGCRGAQYTVRSGDTLFLIARRLGVSLSALQACNPTVNPLNLQIGQRLCTPG